MVREFEMYLYNICDYMNHDHLPRSTFKSHSPGRTEYVEVTVELKIIIINAHK